MIYRFKLFLALALLWLAGLQPASAQTPYKTFRVYFKDKNYSPYSLANPLAFLSQQSLDRRQRQGLTLNETDLPVSPAYLDSLKQAGAKILYTSRWLNAATIEINDSLFLDKLNKFSFIERGKRVFRQVRGETHALDFNMLASTSGYSMNDYGPSYFQVAMLHGDVLHNAGDRGDGMRIGILDAGFYKADSLPAFDSLRKRSGILATKDFVEKGGNVFTADRHGMYVLSSMSGILPGQLIGTAPSASYFLIRTENAASENLIEEDSWVAGLEWADSAGAEVMNSSLGYSTFDDPNMNHTYTELNGETAYASRAASMAASKGMIVVNSAGNSGNSPWHYISVPADAENILTVGAVNKNYNVAIFSSRGPAADGRVKPDVMALGFQTMVAMPNGSTGGVNGTSLAAPLITGLVACLWQEFPAASSFKVMDAVRRSAHRYAFPSDSMGYGIPNFELAREILKDQSNGSEDYITEIYPNPFSDAFTISFYTSEAQAVEVHLYDAMGRDLQIVKEESETANLNKIGLAEGLNLPHGIYFVSIRTKDKLMVRKVIRD